MNTLKKTLLVLLAVPMGANALKKPTFIFFDNNEAITAHLTFTVGHGASYSRGASLLNTTVRGALNKMIDQVCAQKTKFQATGYISAGGIEAQATLRANSAWGSNKTITTSPEFVKFGETLLPPHVHTLGVRALYLQEAWTKYNIESLFGPGSFIQIGMFPYSLGNGIALGSAYAVNPTSLGFYGDRSIDMYAPGLLFSADLNGFAVLDSYLAITKNQSTSLSDTGDQIYDQLVVNGSYPTNFAAGSGLINFIAAESLNFNFNLSDKSSVASEFYFLYNYDPMQRVEFFADAKSKLMTFGTALDFKYNSKFEFGVEAAFNGGHQDVYAWDRNRIILQRTNAGTLAQVHSHIFTDGDLDTNVVYTGDTTAYRVDNRFLSSALNSTDLVASQIHDAVGANVADAFNAKDRYRDAYRNKYSGLMVVSDASLQMHRDFKIALSAGVATGDVNPNTDQTGAVRDYKGFVSLQELYAGKRVKSVFVMGPLSSIVRPAGLSKNTRNVISGVDNFSNLAFLGFGCTFMPLNRHTTFSINPNVIFYMQEKETKAYDAVNNRTASNFADKRLGYEANLFAFFELSESTKLVMNGAIFVPGQHYAHLVGAPLASQVNHLKKLADAGVTENLPTLSNQVATTLSIGLETTF